MTKRNGRAISGADILDQVHEFLGRFIAYPSPEAHTAHTLWCAHTHALDAFESTPRIAFLSPEPGSGKTRALEITALLAPRPVEAINMTAAYLFRKVGDQDNRATILFDEIDTVFGPKARENEDIRALLNAGHRRGAKAGRCVVKGKRIVTEEIEAFGAVAMAGLHTLPDTILSRCVVIRMRRRAPTEIVAPFRCREHEPDGHALRDALKAWTAGIIGQLADARPIMPAGVTDRPADVWEPLLAIADAAGGPWPERARVSCVSHVSASMRDTHSLGVRLLSDLRDIFCDQATMFTADILEALHHLDESPWGDIRGKPLDPRGIARLLKPYEVESKQVRVGGRTAKGYHRDDLLDPWRRYLCVSPMETETSETCETVTNLEARYRGVRH